ncbi:MAG: Hpt domain-containing protein [Desulfobulbaceae bacterium]|nr:Hpt domain-containing protein [Desulfobulbaceae bacterium]
MQKSEYREKIRAHFKKAYNLPDKKMDEVLPRFLKLLADHLEKFEQISTKQDLLALCRAGHSLKGALLNMGLEELAEETYQLEKLCKSNNKSPDIVRLSKELMEKIKVIL